jgi:hypothetical protein
MFSVWSRFVGKEVIHHRNEARDKCCNMGCIHWGSVTIYAAPAGPLWLIEQP